MNVAIGFVPVKVTAKTSMESGKRYHLPLYYFRIIDTKAKKLAFNIATL